MLKINRKIITILFIIVFLIVQGTLLFFAITLLSGLLRSFENLESIPFVISTISIIVGGISVAALILTKKIPAAAKLFFGVEIPLTLLPLFYYVTRLKSFTWWFAILLILISCIAFIFSSLKFKLKGTYLPRLQSLLLLVGFSLSFFIFGIFLFFVPAIISSIRPGLFVALFSPLQIVYFVTTVVLLFNPVYVWILFAREFTKLNVELFPLHSVKSRSLLLHLVVAFMGVYALLVATNTSFIFRHPIELKTAEDYNYFYNSKTPEKLIADGLSLRNYYLLDKEDSSIKDIFCKRYQENCGIEWYQSLFTLYMSPFVYQGNLPDSGDTAKVLESLYERKIEDYISITTLNKELSEKQISTVSNPLSRIRTVSGPRVLLTSEIYDIDVKVTPQFEEKVQKGTMAFTFSTKNSTQGEAVFDVVLPPDARITGLTLGRNLENKSYVVPDFAAERVYETSVRRAIDPAVIKQVGPSTYRIRVFPIFTEQKDVAKMQKIRIEYVAPLHIKVIPPVISAQLGTTIRKQMNSYTTVGENGAEIVSEHNFTDFVSTDNELAACTADKALPATNAVLFIDISKSAEASREKYKKLLSAMSEDLQIDVFFVNQNVSAAAKKVTVKQLYSDLDKLSFWGYSSEDSWRDAMQTKTTGYDHVILLTDNDTFVRDAEKVDLYDFSTLKFAHMTILSADIGPLQDAKLNYSAIAKRADVIFLADNGSLIPYTTYCEVDSYANSIDATVRGIKLVGDEESKLLTATNKDSYLSIMSQITQTAKDYHMVTLGNSMIAIETEEQKKALESESNKNSVYDLTNMTGIGLPENNEIGLLAVLVIGATTVYLLEKRKQKKLF